MTDWRCKECRAQVAPGAPRCPQCPSTKFTEVGELPNITSAGVFFEPGKEPDGWQPEPAPAAPAGPELPAPPPASAPKADHVEYATGALGVPEDEAAAMTKPELVDLARSAGEPEAPAPAPLAPPRRVPPPVQG